VEVHDPRAEEDWAVTLAETGDSAHTAARVWRARRFLGEGPFCVAYGDGLADVALDELVRFHKSHGRLATVTGVRPPGRYGSLQLAADGSVTSFVEKPHATAQFVNGGFFVFEPGFIERYLSDDESVDLEGAPLQRATADGELMLWRHERFWQHLDTARDQALLDELWRSGRAPWKLWP
jgi:glucose-1-phosphate cytidylyltransferase